MTIPSYQQAVHLAKTGQLADAEAMCQQLLGQSPGDYQLLYLNCSIQLMSGHYEACSESCHRLLELNDKNADVYNILAAISSSHDKDDAETEKWLRLALACDPDNRKVLVNLGNMRFFANALEEAESLFKRATSASSPNADAIGGLAMIASRRGDDDGAISGYKQALELDSGATTILSNLILALYKVGRKEEAMHYAAFTASMEHPGIASVPAMTVAKNHCLFDAAERLLPFAVNELSALPDDLSLYSFSSLSFLGSASINNAQVLAIHRQAASVIRRHLKHVPYQDYPKAFARMSQIRIGYLSSDFNAHVLGHFFRGLINYRDRSRFEIYMYSNLAEAKEDTTTQQYRAAADHFVNVVDLTDEELAKRIHDDGIHILVEMNGHLGSVGAPRLPVLAYRPAPVQVAYLNYPYSYGMEEVDYVISDPWLNGPDNARYFDEQPLEMPQSFLTIGHYFEKEIDAVPPRARKHHITFGSLTSIYKLNAKTIALWSKVLQHVLGSRMYLNHPAYSLAGSRDSLIAEFAKHGIPADRIDIVWERHPSGSHLRYYNEIDIALDTLPLTGGTTTVDSLWMAVPVVTLVGEAHAQRLSYSIINNIGVEMADCLSFSEDEYVNRAVALASNPARLDMLREQLATMMPGSILCDPVSFTKQFESLYINAWNRKFPSKHIGDDMTANKHIPLPIADTACSIVVNDNLDDIYHYVLREQQQWFENEAAFLANTSHLFKSFWDFAEDPGVYAVPIAQRQSGGQTLAIRPAGEIAELLSESIALNKLGNLAVVSSPDDAQPLPDLVRFSLDYNDGEGNLLAPWLDKVDPASPLVLVSLHNQQGSDFSAMPVLAERGYQSYRLLPGYGLLVPHRFGDPMYASDINLFFCKPDRAEQLVALGVLCQQAEDIQDMPAVEANLWKDLLIAYPYASTKLLAWIEREPVGKWGEMYLTALNLHTGAVDVSLSPAQRYARIQLLQTIISLLIQGEATVSRLLTAIRVMVGVGNRELAVQWSNVLVNGLQETSGVVFDEPFLMPESLWEASQPTEDEALWAYSIALVTTERLSRFSSWFTAEQGLPVWEHCLQYPWLQPMAENMVTLINGRAAAMQPVEIVGHITGKTS